MNKQCTHFNTYIYCSTLAHRQQALCVTIKLVFEINYLLVKQAASLKLGNLREKVVLYKIGRFLWAYVSHRVSNFQIRKTNYKGITQNGEEGILYKYLYLKMTLCTELA